MDCDKCKNKVVAHAFSEGVCNICDGHVSTPHIPCNVICHQCGEANNLCESCGEKINKDE